MNELHERHHSMEKEISRFCDWYIAVNGDSDSDLMMKPENPYEFKSIVVQKLFDKGEWK